MLTMKNYPKKYKPNMTCQVTGEVSDDNLKLANGKLVLSREGAEQIINEIQNQLQSQNKFYKKVLAPFARTFLYCSI